MKFFFLLLFFSFSFLFSCNTYSNKTAYKEYSKNKKIYINSILDDNKQKKISSLKNMIDCGRFLGFNVEIYQQRLKQILQYKKKNIRLKIIDTNPLRLKVSRNSKVTFFKIDGEYHKRILDISNIRINKNFFKGTSKIHIKIANYKRNVVRVVLYSKSKFKILYSLRKGILVISYWPVKQESTREPIRESTRVKKAIIKTSNHRKNTHIKKNNLIIVIDPGHGGKDPGGIGYNKRQEKKVTLAVGKDLYYELKNRGYKVYLTRNKDYFVTLRNRTKFANRKRANLFISIHCNISPRSSKTMGITTYFLSPARTARAERVARLENSAIGNLRTTTQQVVLNFLNRKKIIQSDKFAIDVQKNALYSLRKNYNKIKDGGVREAPFWVLVGTQMPAILVELGFLTNPLESARLYSKQYQKVLAKGIANGVDSYFRKNE